MQWLFKNIKTCYIVTVIILFVLGVISFIMHPSYEFDMVYQLRYEDDCFYGIDFNDYKITAFRMNADGTEFSSRELPVYQGTDTVTFSEKTLKRTESGWIFDSENKDAIINHGNTEYTECRLNAKTGMNYGIYVTEKGSQVPAIHQEEKDTVFSTAAYVFIERLTRAFFPYAIAFLLITVLFLFIYFTKRREEGVSLLSEFIILLYPFLVAMVIVMFSFVHDVCFSIAENASQANLLTDARITSYLLQTNDSDNLILRYDGKELFAPGTNGEELWRNHTDSKKLRAALSAAEKNQPVLLRYAADDVVYDSIFMAVVNEAGIHDTIVEERNNIFPSLVKVQRQADNTFFLIFAIIIGIFISIACVLLFECYRMKTASKAIMKAGEGDIDSVDPMLGFTEVPVLIRNVNTLLSRLSNYRMAFDRLNEKYQAFIPQIELELLGEDRTSGDVKVREKVINAASISYFRSDIKLREIDSDFEAMLDAMNERGLVLHHLDSKGFYGFSCRGCNMLLESTNKMLEFDHMGEGCAALTEGMLHIGMTGGFNRASVFLISSDKVLSDFLAERGCGIGCSMIVTDRFREKISKRISSYHLRELGDVYNRNDQSITVIYEILDVQHGEKRRLKEQTRILFEQGVQFFRDNQILKARRCFVQVMDQNGSDKAAMYYIMLCDGIIRNPEKEKEKHHIFEYGSWE